MILDGRVEDAQLGAFLMLLRHKEESSEELAGFTEAVRERLQVPSLRVDLDWPSYAGKKRHLPWYLLAAKCLAGHGVRILMHGGGAHTAGRLYSEQLLAALEIPLCHDWLQVEQALERGHLAFIPLGAWMPVLQRMIDLRNTLGLRSPIHSLVRLLNPLNADCILQSIFHPGYQKPTARPAACSATGPSSSRAKAARSKSTRTSSPTCMVATKAKPGTRNGRHCRRTGT